MPIRGRWKKAIGGPLSYAIWALLVIVALAAAYWTEPYVFAFTTLGLAWLNGAMTLLGLAGAWRRRAEGWRPAVRILGAVILAWVAIASAFAVLSTFRWA